MDNKDAHEHHLTISLRKLKNLSNSIVEKYGPKLQSLDASHNEFGRDFDFLKEFEHLKLLDLSYNNVDGSAKFPKMLNLQILLLDHNKIDSIDDIFLQNLSQSCPNIRLLTLTGNKAAPNHLSYETFYDYLMYRLKIIYWFPKLQHLDNHEVTKEQREESNRIFKKPLLKSLYHKFIQLYS